MFSFMSLIQVIAYIAMAVVAFMLLRDKWQEGQLQRDHEATKADLGRAGTYTSDDPIGGEKQPGYNLQMMGLPDVRAGQTLMSVPCVDPKQEAAWDKNRTVLTTARIHVLCREEPQDLELIELSGGYVILVKGSKTFVMSRYNLTAIQEKYLEEQRRASTQRDDMVIESFLDHSWDIKGCMGDIVDDAGQTQKSKIQVLTVIDGLGQPGMKSIIPPELFDKAPHDYYDIEAVCAETGQVMLVFYAAKTWACFIGKPMAEEDADRLQAI